MKVFVKHALFLLILLLLVLPELQQRLGFFPDYPLQGAFSHTEPPDFDSLRWDTWLHSEFQEDFNNRLESSIGFHDWLVRLNNQLKYSLFHEANAEGVIVGRDGELYEEDYIRAYLGHFNVGNAVWERKSDQLKRVQDTLKSLDISLAVVFEPGKGSFYPDRFPAKYDAEQGTTSNYEVFRHLLQQKGIHVLDLNQFFLQSRDKHEYLLFPQTGTHWSYYGALLAADTTLAFLRNIHGPQIPEMRIDSLRFYDLPRHPDDDIWLAMNLLSPVPQQPLAYPVVSFDTQEQPPAYDVLVVGDSYYFNWQSDGVMLHAFRNADFWYYNKAVWGRQGSETGSTGQLIFRDEILRRDIILIMITERFHHNFAWKFDEQLFELFFPHQWDMIDYYADNLRVSNDQFMRLVKDASQKGIPIEQRIRMEAEFLLFEDYQKHPEKYTRKEDLISILMMSIRGTPEWFDAVKEKAAERNIPLDEMVRMDAEWIYNDKYGKNIQ
jgi:hypothetical protein